MSTIVTQLCRELRLPTIRRDAVRVAEEAERQQLHQHWAQRLERAHFEAARAYRQYNAVEPLCGHPRYVA